MIERDDSSPDRGGESRIKVKKTGITDTDIGFTDGKDHSRLWKREDFMEKATTELDVAKDGGKIKGYKLKKK